MQYGYQSGSVRGFSWKSGITKLPDRSLTSSPLGLMSRRLSLSSPSETPYGLERGSMHRAWPILLRPRLLQRHPWQHRNINLSSITYAFRPRLRYRLTHGRIILPQETLGLRRPGFSPGLSLLMPAYSLVMPGNSRSRLSCICMTTLAYHSPKRIRSFGTKLKPR